VLTIPLSQNQRLTKIEYKISKIFAHSLLMSLTFPNILLGSDHSNEISLIAEQNRLRSHSPARLIRPANRHQLADPPPRQSARRPQPGQSIVVHALGLRMGAHKQLSIARRVLLLPTASIPGSWSGPEENAVCGAKPVPDRTSANGGPGAGGRCDSSPTKGYTL